VAVRLVTAEMVIRPSSAQHPQDAGRGWPQSPKIQGHQVPRGGPSETAAGSIPGKKALDGLGLSRTDALAALQSQRQTQSFGPSTIEDLAPGWQDRAGARQRGVECFEALRDWAARKLELGYFPTMRGQLRGPLYMVTGTFRDVAMIHPRSGKIVFNPDGDPVKQMRLSESRTWKDVWRFHRKNNNDAYGGNWMRKGSGLGGEGFYCVEPHQRGALHFHGAIAGLVSKRQRHGPRFNDIRANWPHGFMWIEETKTLQGVVDYLAKHVIGYVSSGKHGRSVWDYFGTSGST